MSSGTGCRAQLLHRADGIVGVNFTACDRKAAPQAQQQLLQAVKLGSRGLLEIKVPQHKNTNVALVERTGARMGSNPVKMPALPGPAGRIDNQVVANIIPAIRADMRILDRLDRPADRPSLDGRENGSAGMMNSDPAWLSHGERRPDFFRGRPLLSWKRAQLDSHLFSPACLRSILLLRAPEQGPQNYPRKRHHKACPEQAAFFTLTSFLHQLKVYPRQDNEKSRRCLPNLFIAGMLA